MSKVKYYKLGKDTHVFYDTTSRLKVTANVPGVTDKPKSKLTLDAIRNGHIQEIDEDTYKKMVSKLTPGEKEAHLAEVKESVPPQPAQEENDEDKEEEEDNKTKKKEETKKK